MAIAPAIRVPTIKPGDLVRTPSGATATVLEINPDGSRELELLNGQRLALLPGLLFLVRAALPRPWPSLRLDPFGREH